MKRSEALSALTAVAVATPLAGSARSAAEAPAPKRAAVTRTVRVPFDYDRPGDGSFDLPYYIAHDFDAKKPTLLFLGDGQQFHIRPDLLPDYQPTYGDVNLVGIAGRGFAPGLQVRFPQATNVDWVEAYRFLRYERWTDDANAVRRDLLGARGKASLYGASGGGELVHEYLSRHGDTIDRAFTQSAVNAYLDAQLGFDPDHFWLEIANTEREDLARVLSERPGQRTLYAQIFQRQNFFVPFAEIAQARADFIAALVAKRDDVVRELSETYQVNAVRAMYDTPVGVAIRVRLYEFFAPLADRFDQRADPTFRPNLESAASIARPLLDLRSRGMIPTPTFRFDALHDVRAEVTQVAGRYDHTADYRSQIALSSHYRNHRLIVVDDDHTFHKLYGARGAFGRLIRGALRGFNDPAFADGMESIKPLLWREA